MKKTNTGSAEDVLGIDYMIVKKYNDDLFIELRKIPWWRLLKFYKIMSKIQVTLDIMDIMLKEKSRVLS